MLLIYDIHPYIIFLFPYKLFPHNNFSLPKMKKPFRQPPLSLFSGYSRISYMPSQESFSAPEAPILFCLSYVIVRPDFCPPDELILSRCRKFTALLSNYCSIILYLLIKFKLFPLSLSGGEMSCP